MDRRRFRRLVEEAIDTLPPEFRIRMENVTVTVEDDPSEDQIESSGLDPAEETIFGIYEGTPVPEREFNFGMTLPDRVVIFYRPLVESFRGPAEIREQVRITVIHEIAHFFGMDDDEIEDLGY